MFFPWVGSRFGDKDNFLKGERLLIVGESHYPGEENQYLAGKTYPEQTQETIQELAIDHPYRFFKVLSRLATGTPNEAWSAKQNSAFWHSIAFYNFVPVFLKRPADRGRPTKAEWELGKKPFIQVLDEIKPSVVIVCGLGLWWYVMDALPGGVAANSPRRDVAQIGTGRGLRIPHPTGSRGVGRYSYETSRPQLEALLLSDRPS